MARVKPQQTKVTTARQPPAVVSSTNNPMKKVMVANNHTGSIIIPRSIKGPEEAIHRIALAPLVFPSSTVTVVDGEVWGKIKKTNQMIQKYLDAGLLTEVRRKGGIVATVAQTSNLIPPEHLKTPDELKGSVRLSREDVREIEV